MPAESIDIYSIPPEELLVMVDDAGGQRPFSRKYGVTRTKLQNLLYRIQRDAILASPVDTVRGDIVDPELKQWAISERQCEYIDAVNECGSITKAALKMGVNASSISESIRRVRMYAAAKGFSPAHDLTHIIADPFVAKGHSTYYDKAGKPTQQWVKTKLDDQRYLELIKEAVTAFVQDVVAFEVAPPQDNRAQDIIPWIEIGDGHLGMLAHEAETGANFDLKIAERELCAAISILIDEMGEHDRAVINDLGDFTHYENFSATTEASGHALDFDGRFPRMIKVYSRVMRFIIEKVLEKVNVVDVIVNQGNHSRTNDIWMAELLRVAYGQSGRVNVLNNDSVFIGYRMGNTFVMTHHSDQCRPARLAQVMATDFAKDWGETEFRYIDIGHIHHGMVMKEHAGVSIESFNTLAPKDKWAANNGYRARQSITVIKRSRSYGEIGRRTLSIREIQDRIADAHKHDPKSAPYRAQAQRAFAV